MTAKIENMAEVAQAFTSAYDHVQSHMVDTKRREEISLFVTQVTAMMSLYISFAPGQLERFIEVVFSKESIRDFVFRLTSAFCARLGGQAEYEALAKDIAFSMCMLPKKDQHGNDTFLVAMPDDIKNRLPSAEDILDLLLGNKWYLTVVMLHLFVRIELTAIPRGQTK